MSEKRKIQRFNLDEGRIWEAIEGLSPFKTTYTLEEVCEKLNELNKEFEDCCQLLDSKDDFIHKFKRDIEELGISIKLFEDDIATKDKKIEEQQATITKLRNENIILKNKIEDLRVSLFIQDQVLQRQMQKSDLDE